MNKVYGYSIDIDTRRYEIMEMLINPMDDDDIYPGPAVLSLPHVDDIDMRHVRANTQVFNNENEIMEFINEQRKRERNSYNMSFILYAYEVHNEHYIKIYYENHYSNS